MTMMMIDHHHQLQQPRHPHLYLFYSFRPAPMEPECSTLSRPTQPYRGARPRNRPVRSASRANQRSGTNWAATAALARPGGTCPPWKAALAAVVHSGRRQPQGVGRAAFGTDGPNSKSAATATPGNRRRADSNIESRARAGWGPSLPLLLVE